ncbi:MAG: transglycosylase SLT domain-containing protein [Elusimicrobia bacterium]|nr:transglycosylase SLT domain-containing protein [Elusimicrobiota bacterium]
MRNFFTKLPVWAALICISAPLQAQKPQTSAPDPKVAVELAAISAPGLDFARLGHFFDAARVRMEQVVTPTAKSWTSPDAAKEIEFSKPQKHQAPVIPLPHETPAYRHTFSVLLSHPEVTDRYDEVILRNAELYRLDARLLKSVIAAESEFFIGAVSPRGARGLMQVMPATAKEMGVPFKHLNDPEDNIRAGAAYLARLFSAAWRYYKLGVLSYADAPLWLKQRVIAAYNAGPRFLFHDRWYTQTKNYVRKVVLFYGSRVTDMRRAPASLQRFPHLSSAPSGILY